jgi:hypothetical protein
METREGVIVNTTDDTLKDDQSGLIVIYTNPGAVAVQPGEGVVYVRITTGNGKEINIIQRKKM